MNHSNNAGNCVLIIDDEASVRNAVVDILDIMGIHTLSTDNGPDGIQLYQENKASIGLILLDLSMPGMAGDQVLQALRQLDNNVNVIISSGYDAADVVTYYQVEGATGYLRKPFNAEELLNLVDHYLS